MKVDKSGHKIHYSQENMGQWKSKQFDKKKKGSSTPGSSKGESCQATGLQKYMTSSSRSYKHKEYGNWCTKMDARNGIKHN